MKQKKQENRLILILCCALLGALAFLLVYGITPLQATNDAWLLGGYDEQDINQHYAGWLAFRNSPWAFPLGYTSALSTPDGVIISYTDSIPWVAIFFKLLRGILPATWQYFGLYAFLCFILQGVAAGLLISRFADKTCTLLGTGFFLLCPILLDRTLRHTALGSHWLILFAMYYYLSYRDSQQKYAEDHLGWGGAREVPRSFPWQMFLLNVLAIGIHPYLMTFTMLFTLLACIQRGCCVSEHAVICRLKAAGLFAANLGLTAFAGWCIGAVGWSPNDSRDGFGFFSMNLNAPINPVGSFGYRWSRILPALPRTEGQYEGFNYLGLGVILLILAALIRWHEWADAHPKAAKEDMIGWLRNNIWLLAAGAFLILFALSNVVTLGSLSVTVPLPRKLLKLCGIFRSSGRMFYPVWYMLLLGSLRLFQRGCSRMVAALGLALLLLVQVIDLSGVLVKKHTDMRLAAAGENGHEIFRTEELLTLGETHDRLLLTGNKANRDLSILALRQGMTCNAVIATGGGEYGGAWQSMMDIAFNESLSGAPDRTSVYATGDEWMLEQWKEIYKTNRAVKIVSAGDLHFLIPITSEGEQEK